MRSEGWKSLQSVRGWQGAYGGAVRSKWWCGKERVVEEPAERERVARSE